MSKGRLATGQPAISRVGLIHQNEPGPYWPPRWKLEGILWMLVFECLWNQTALKDYRAEHDIRTPFRQLTSSNQTPS